MKRYISTFLIYSLYLFQPIHAQTLTDELKLLLDETLDSMHNVVGNKSLSAAIIYPGEEQWTRAIGISSQFPLIAPTPDDAYEIGSVGKTLTAACILQMADDGLLSIDDTVGQWFSDLPHVNPSIKVRQLMQHTSGLYDVLSSAALNQAMNADMDSIWNAEDVIVDYMQAPLADPGEGWSYCNSNYFLLGMIIEAVSGQPFYTEIRNRFFTPLALNTFGIPAFENYTQPVAHVWMDITGDGWVEDAHNFFMDFMSLNSVAGAAGGFFATPLETSKWMRSYMRGDLISPSLMAQAKTTIFAPGTPTTYGLGLMKKNFVGYVGFGHGGDLAYSASSWYFPELDISITVCNNDAGTNSWELIPVVEALLQTIDDYNELNTVISERNTIEEFSLYPNPFSSSIQITCHAAMQDNISVVNMYDALGHVIRSRSQIRHSGTNNFMLFDDLSDLQHGLYWIEVISDQGKKSIYRMLK